MLKHPAELRVHSRNILLLIIFAYGLLMFGNGMISLTHPDEVFYTQTAKEMVSQNSWLTPYIFDQPQFEKPIFFFWLLAFGVKLFGAGPFVARFWPAFFGILGVVVTYWLSWILFRKQRVSFLSALVLLTSFIYIALSRAVLTDMVFSIWVVLSLACFCWSYYQPTAKNVGLICWWLFAALAVLTKGLLGLCFTLTPVVFFLLYKRELSFFRCQAFGTGLILFLLAVIPWHWKMYQWYGKSFLEEYWQNVHVNRLLVAEHRRCDTWYFYPGVMLGGLMPWSLFLFPALALGIQNLRNKTEHRDPMIFLLFWILGVFLFIQPAHSKLASYVFPIFPAEAILVGYYLNSLGEQQKGLSPQSAFRLIGLLWPLVLVLLGIGAIVYAKVNQEMIVNFQPVYFFSLMLFVCAAAQYFFYVQKKFIQAAMTNASITVAVLLTLFSGRQYAEPWVSCKQIAENLKVIDQSDTVVLASKFYARAIRFYTDRKLAVIDINGKGFYSPHPIPFLNTDEGVRQLLDSQPFTYAIVKEGNVEDLTRITAGRYHMWNLGGTGGKYIVRIEKI